jgi:chromosome segregation ATPase
MSGSSSPSSVLETPETPPVQKWESEEEFEARLKRIQSKAPAAGAEAGANAAASPDVDVAALVAENERLKALVQEARRRSTQFEEEATKAQKREHDFEMTLEEKSEEIRKLETELAAFKSKQSTGVTEEELLALHAELERERQTLDEDRQAMEEQFRQLEMNMSRERAEIARERNEMQRTKTELKHKLEMLEKNSLQGDLSPLRRLREEITGAPAAGQGGRPVSPPLPVIPNMPVINRRAPENDPGSPKRSGILSRFLGNKNE